jgi:hypothetical protein
MWRKRSAAGAALCAEAVWAAPEYPRGQAKKCEALGPAEGQWSEGGDAPWPLVRAGVCGAWQGSATNERTHVEACRAPGSRPPEQRPRTGPTHTMTIASQSRVLSLSLKHTMTATAFAAAFAVVCVLCMHTHPTRAPLQGQLPQYKPLHCRCVGRRRVQWPTDTTRYRNRYSRPQRTVLPDMPAI